MKRKIMYLFLLVFTFLLVILFAGCGVSQEFKNIVGTWEAGVMTQKSNDAAMKDNSVLAENNAYPVLIDIKETGTDVGTISVLDVYSSKLVAFNFSASTLNSLFSVPFTFEHETGILTGEISTKNKDGTSERTKVHMIAIEMKDKSNTALNGTIEMELFNADGTSAWITTCTINAYKTAPELSAAPSQTPQAPSQTPQAPSQMPATS